MQYVYVGMAALILVIFAYKKLSATKRTNEYLPEKETKKK